MAVNGGSNWIDDFSGNLGVVGEFLDLIDFVKRELKIFWIIDSFNVIALYNCVEQREAMLDI
jgi:hypothetical protein